MKRKFSNSAINIVRVYILENMDFEGYTNNEGNPFSPQTDSDKFGVLRSIFEKEYGHEIARKGYNKAVSEWLSGLPSSVNIAFYNWDIVSLGKKWELLPETENSQDDYSKKEWSFIETWFDYLAYVIVNS